MIRRHVDRESDGTPRRVILSGVAVAVALSASAAAFVVGRSSVHPTASVSPPPPAPAPPMPSMPAGATRHVAGVPEGYPHTRDGARLAALGFLRVEVSDLMSRPDAYRAAWREMCTPEYFAASGRDAAESVITDQQANNHLVSNAAAGQRVYERLLPLTAGVVAYTDDAARVRDWSLLVSHPGDGPTVVSFGAGTLELRWSGADWKLNGGRASSSPTEGASGSLRLDDGPGLPSYLGDLPGVDDAPPVG